MSLFSCILCKKEFKRKSELYKHERRSHNIKQICVHCKNVFVTKLALKVHNKTCKPNENKDKRGHNARLKCSVPECESFFMTYKCLRSHILEEHKIELPEKCYEFNNISDFEEWKQHIEVKENSKFVQDSGEKKRKDHFIRYYVCYRSYEPRLLPTSVRTRRIKSLGSNKISRACPATMILKRYEKKVYVTFYPTHVGHINEVERTHLSKEERYILAGRLSEGVPVERVLEDVRLSLPISDGELERIHLLKRKDLLNIKRDFGIDCARKKQNNNDAISIKTWIDGMQRRSSETNPVLFFEQENENLEIANIDEMPIMILSDLTSKEEDNAIQKKCEEILELTKRANLSPSIRKQILVQLNEAAAILKKQDLVTQKQFFSTKKKRNIADNNNSPSPSELETVIINDSFTCDSNETLNLSCDNSGDHGYSKH